MKTNNYNHTHFLRLINTNSFRISNLKIEPVGSLRAPCNAFFNKELNTHLSSIIKSAGSKEFSQVSNIRRYLKEPASYLIQVRKEVHIR